MTLRLKDLIILEHVVFLLGFLLIDPFMLERSKATTVCKGNQTVSVEVYGKINGAVMWAGREKRYVIGNG
jgi:hypothetical protein